MRKLCDMDSGFMHEEISFTSSVDMRICRSVRVLMHKRKICGFWFHQAKQLHHPAWHDMIYLLRGNFNYNARQLLWFAWSNDSAKSRKNMSAVYYRFVTRSTVMQVKYSSKTLLKWVWWSLSSWWWIWVVVLAINLVQFILTTTF